MIPSAIARIAWRLGDGSPDREAMDLHRKIPTGGDCRGQNRHIPLRCRKSAIADRRHHRSADKPRLRRSWHRPRRRLHQTLAFFRNRCAQRKTMRPETPGRHVSHAPDVVPAGPARQMRWSRTGWHRHPHAIRPKPDQTANRIQFASTYRFGYPATCRTEEDDWAYDCMGQLPDTCIRAIMSPSSDLLLCIKVSYI